MGLGRPISSGHPTGLGFPVKFRYSIGLGLPIGVGNPAAMQAWVISAGLITLSGELRHRSCPTGLY